MSTKENFVIVTPVKNESKNLRLLSNSISRQAKKPSLWLIVDDGSDLDTQEVIKEILKSYAYVRSIRINHSSKYDVNRYPVLIKMGFEIISGKVDTEFLAVLDSDVILADNYFDIILEQMRLDLQLGITAGLMMDKFAPPAGVWGDVSVAGAAMVIRKVCYDQIGGFPLIHAMPDTILQIKAIKSGWKVSGLKTTSFIHLKPHGWKRWLKSGLYNAWVGYHPVNALFTSIYVSLKPPYLVGVAYFVGFLQGFLSRRRIQDKIMFDYFRKEAFDNLVNNIVPIFIKKVKQ